jgi:hypothetical protein
MAMPRKKYEKKPGPIRQIKVRLRPAAWRAISSVLGGEIFLRDDNEGVATLVQHLAAMTNATLNFATTHLASYEDGTAWLPSMLKAEYRKFIQKPFQLIDEGIERASLKGVAVIGDFNRQMWHWGDAKDFNEDDETFAWVEEGLVERGIPRLRLFLYLLGGFPRLYKWYNRHKSPRGRESLTHRAITAKHLQEDFGDLYTRLCRGLKIAEDARARKRFIKQLFSMASEAAKGTLLPAFGVAVYADESGEPRQ